MDKSNFSLQDSSTQTQSDNVFKESIGDYFDKSVGTTLDKLENFARFVPRQNLALFMAKSAIFEHVIEVHGSIIECGVFMGGGLFTWAQLSAIYEPYNHNRKIIGFDTFSGFPDIHDKDTSLNEKSSIQHKTPGGYSFKAKQELVDGAKLLDINKPLGHIPKIELVEGNACETIPTYIYDNPHTVVSLLYLDFDLYEPTKIALETFLPRMPKGAVIVFDELNQVQWPGETVAIMEKIGLRGLSVKRFPFTPSISYAILD